MYGQVSYIIIITDVLARVVYFLLYRTRSACSRTLRGDDDDASYEKMIDDDRPGWLLTLTVGTRGKETEKEYVERSD
jgi:hypothetical protein